MIRFAAVTVFVLVSFTALSAQEKALKLDDLNWLSGCWEKSDKAENLLISEQWMKPAGGIMLGVGRTVKDGKAVDFEFLRIEQRGDGVFYIAKPRANKEETLFKLIKLETGWAIFENPDHDFPQRVIYKREGDKLTGRIEGNSKGKLKGIDFPMTRVKCD